MTTSGDATKPASSKMDWTAVGLLDLSLLMGSYWFLYVYREILGVDVPLQSYDTLVAMPVMAALIIPLIHYLVVRADHLQLGANNYANRVCEFTTDGKGNAKYRTRFWKRLFQDKMMVFFQAQYPSQYLQARCWACANSGKCDNSIEKDDQRATYYWFRYLFNQRIPKDDESSISRTLEAGWECRLVYTVRWFLGILLALSLVILAVHLVSGYWRGVWSLSTFGSDSLSKTGMTGLVHLLRLSWLQVYFPIICVGAILLLRRLHRAHLNRPSGCWQAWRDINRSHVCWMRDHEDALTEVVCKNNGGAQTFQK